jgi:hypothetical protein
MTDQTRILEEFSKDEIISWLRDKGMLLNRISRRDLLFIRWKKASKKLMADYDADFAKRDALATEFNGTRDATRRLQLLEQMAPYDAALKEHIRRTQTLDKRQEAVDRLYREIDKEAA